MVVTDLFYNKDVRHRLYRNLSIILFMLYQHFLKYNTHLQWYFILLNMLSFRLHGLTLAGVRVNIMHFIDKYTR